MIYMGIDPSTSSTGYAIVDEQETLLASGKILGKADDPKSFANLYLQLYNLVVGHVPDGLVCETQFIGPNKATSIKLIRPTGVVLSVAGLSDCAFAFMEPSEWRKLFHGKGKWTKKDTFALVKERYPNSVQSFTKDNDIADAIGIACACAVRFREGGEPS